MNERNFVNLAVTKETRSKIREIAKKHRYTMAVLVDILADNAKKILIG